MGLLDKSKIGKTASTIKKMDNDYEWLMIPVDKIEYNPNNKRKYSQTDIIKMADTLQTEGLTHNIAVYYQKEKNKYLLLSGERRTKACKMLADEGKEQYKTVMAKVFKKLSPQMQELIMLSANENQTEDAEKIKLENAERIEQLVEHLVKTGEVKNRREARGQLAGKSGKQVERDVKFKELLPELQKLVEAEKLSKAEIIKAHDLNTEIQKQIYKTLNDMVKSNHKPTGKDIQEVIKQFKEGFKDKPKPKGKNTESLKDKKTLDDRKQELNSLSSQKSKIKSAIGKLDGQIQQLNNQIDNAKSENDNNKAEELNIQRRKLEYEKGELENNMKDIASEFKSKEKEIQRLINNKDKPGTDKESLPSVNKNIELGQMLNKFDKEVNLIEKLVGNMKKDNVKVNDINVERITKMRNRLAEILK